MIVRSRGGWLRRVIASSATIVALGAVLVAPQAAFAAPINDVAAAPLLRLTSAPCGYFRTRVSLAGTVDPGTTVWLEAYRADGTVTVAHLSLSPDSSGNYTATMDVDAADTAGVEIFLVTTVISFAPPRVAAHAVVSPARPHLAAPAVVSPTGALASVWYQSGCASLYGDPYYVENKGAPLSVNLSVAGFQPGAVQLSTTGGYSIDPTSVTVPAGKGWADVTVAVADPPACPHQTITFHASQPGSEPGMPSREAETVIDLICPTLKATPASVVDTALPRATTVEGADWLPNEKLQFYIDGQLLAADVYADDVGTFTASPTLPQLDCTQHTLTAAQFDGGGEENVRAIDPITDAAIVKDIPFAVTCSDTSLTATPALLVAKPGPQAIDVRIKGFRRGVPVEFSMPGVTVTPGGVTPTGDNDGETFPLTLNQQPACGKNTLTARQPQNDDALPPKMSTTTIWVLCPLVVAAPDTIAEVNLPEPVTLSGTGWVPTVEAVVSFDGKEIGRTVPRNDGLHGTVTLPRAACGEHRLEVVQAILPTTDVPAEFPRASAPIEPRAVTPIMITCNTPQVFVEPQVLAQKPGPQKLDVKISGFLQGLAAALTLPGTVLDPKEIVPSRTNPGEATVTADKQPACGESTFTAAQIYPGGEFPINRQATQKLYLFCPTFAPKPAAVTDTALAGPVEMTGANWVPNQQIQLLMDAKLVGTVAVDDKGVAAGKPTLPRSACGAHELEAVQVTPIDADPKATHLPPLFAAFELRVKAALTVVCPPAALAVDPGVLVDGNTTDASGVGFTPGRQVVLEWTYEDGTRIGDACAATASAGGTFIVTCLVLPNTTLGTRLLHAVEVVPAGDPVVARTAVAPLLVVPGSMDRGDHHTHGRFLERR